jgi:fibronectin-binding autotransporter adhesin
MANSPSMQCHLDSLSMFATSTAAPVPPLVINGNNVTLDNNGGAALATTNQQFWNSSFAASPLNNLAMGPGTVTLGTDVILTVTTNTFTVPGAITGAYGLVKAGPGVFALGGSNTYSGATIISNGVLKLNAGASLNGTPLIQLAGAATTADVRSVTFTVQSNQVLQGNGLVQGSVSLNPGAILTPGNSIGTLTVSSNLNLTSGVSLHFELGATNASDQVLVGKNLALGGIQFADFLFSTNAGFGEGAYNLFDALTLSGSLGSVTNGSIAGMSAFLWTDTGNNNLMLSVIAIPEPTTLLALGVGLGLLASFRRRTG